MNSARANVVLLHHHLLPGGVTTIIRSQLEALGKSDRYAVRKVIAGSSAGGPRRLPGVTVTRSPAVDYVGGIGGPDNYCAEDLRASYEEIRKLLNRHVHEDDLLHVHNLTLGKNPVLTLAVYERALLGQRVCYHLHDFAEDGRYDNYRALRNVIERVFRRPLPEVLYPPLAGVHFAVINRRDRDNLRRAGVPRDRVTVLHNPVAAPTLARSPREAAARVRKVLDIRDDRPILLYPVRGIRRKNLGEFVLLAALFGDMAHWISTLRPKNPLESQSYDRWVAFSKRLGLAARFAAGEHLGFGDLMAAASKCVTTSVNEGFGMVFLEPWLHGVPVVGRNLRHVTADFKRKGVALNGLYDRLEVPARSPVDRSRLIEQYTAYVCEAYRSLGAELPAERDIVARLRTRFAGRWIDFSALDPSTQELVVERCVESKKYRAAIIEQNRLERGILGKVSERRIDSNRTAIRTAFSIERYRGQLEGIYDTLREPAGRCGPLRISNSLVDSFLEDGQLRLITR